MKMEEIMNLKESVKAPQPSLICIEVERRVRCAVEGGD